ncbi:uncharacterized protein [Watersipora subatra]|uniref:uncharacterized protein n=1 Tax=Watersipora subatra TaxID=2589382 RepID=UPI00355B3DB8
MDPGPSVELLSSLTLIEQLLIAQVNPTMSIFRLPLGGQFGFRGHVINFSQNVNDFVINLPCQLQQIDIIVLRRRVDQVALPANLFTVCRQRVLAALIWLKTNNEFYRNINIIQENIDALPIDDIVELPDHHIVQELDADLPPAPNPDNGANNANEANNNEPNLQRQQNIPNDHIIPNTCTFAPAQRPAPNENQAIQAAIDNNDVIDWPAIQGEPINEFNTVGYITRAFPVLFPTGSADLRAPHAKPVFARDYFKHLLYYKDGRFQADPRFVFLAYNSTLRWQSIQVGQVFIQNNPNEREMSVADIRQLVNENQ